MDFVLSAPAYECKGCASNKALGSLCHDLYKYLLPQQFAQSTDICEAGINPTNMYVIPG
jgi:hypothetical protein